MVVAELFATVLGISMIGGVGYWGYVLFDKYRFVIKYKLLRKQYHEEDVKLMISYLNAGKSVVDVHKIILLDPNNKKTKAQVKELLYIFSELDKIERRENK